MKILIIGGTGFISGEIARLAAAAGHEVVLFNRGEAAPDAPFRSLRGDARALLEHAAALRAEEPEVVVHAIAGTEQAGRDAAAAFAGTGARLLVLGSMDVYDALQQAMDKREIADFPLDEASPVTPTRYYYRGRMPGDARAQDYDKNLMTAALMAAHERGDVRAAVFRCPMVYGPKDRQFAHRHGPVLRRIADGRTRLTMGLQDQGRIWTFGYVTNVAAAVVHAFDRPAVDGRIYNLGERTWRSKRRWAELYAAAAGIRFTYHLLPDDLLGEDPADAPPMHLLVDSGLYSRDTGFEEPTPLEQAVRETLEWALAHPEALGSKPDYDAEDRLIAGYEAAVAALRPEPGQ